MDTADRQASCRAARRVAWFSPLPPSTSGIAAYSAELLPLLQGRGLEIDTFSEANAHEFVWKRRRTVYDLTVFQIGNAQCHDYMWAYLFRYPGVLVLHDAQLHQARALYLTKRWQPRRADYLAEFRANHPDAPSDIAELVAAGLGGTLYQHWPLIRLVVESARMTVVHNKWLADDLRQRYPAARVEAIDMGIADPLATATAGAEDVRQRHGIPQDAVVLAAFGGITPEKRIPQIMRAFGAIAERHPQLHLMLVGSGVGHYDVLSDAEAWRVADRVHVSGFVPDELLPAYLLASDVCASLRWPTNRETSASWLRCIAAGRPTIVSQLAHLADVPTLDPRGWRVLDISSESRQPVALSIDLLDEEHSLQLALERLATDKRLRDELGRTARAWWLARHQLEPMAAAYTRLVADACNVPSPAVALPAHLTNDGSQRARALLDSLGVTDAVSDLFAK